MRAGCGGAPDRSPFVLSPNLRNGYECRCGLAEGLRAQALTREDARAVRQGQARQGADLRRPAPRRAPAPLRLPARARRRSRSAGPSRRACRSSRARSTSPSTSRTTRSRTRRSRARSRPGNYGAGTVEIWDQGTYELVEEKPNGGLTVHLHGERLDGPWTLVPAKLGGDPKNWLLVKKKTRRRRRRASGAPTRRCSRRSPTRCRPARGGCTR